MSGSNLDTRSSAHLLSEIHKISIESAFLCKINIGILSSSEKFNQTKERINKEGWQAGRLAYAERLTVYIDKAGCIAGCSIAQRKIANMFSLFLLLHNKAVASIVTTQRLLQFVNPSVKP